MERTREGHERLSVLSIQQLVNFCTKCPDHIKRLKQLVALDEKAKQYHCYDSLGVTFTQLDEKQNRERECANSK